MGVEVFHRRVAHLGQHGFGVGGARRLHGLQVVQHGAVDVGLQVGGQLALRLAKALGPGARSGVFIPVKAHHQRKALGRLVGQGHHVGRGQGKGNHLLPGLADLEFVRLLDGVQQIGASAQDADVVGLRRLGLQQVRAEIGGPQRKAHCAERFAALRLHRRAGVFLKAVARCVVHRQKVPGFGLALVRALDREVGQRIAVATPLQPVGRAGFAGDLRRVDGRDQHLVLFLREPLHRQRHARVVDVEHGIHALGVVPAAGDGRADIRLVLMVCGHQLDRLAQHQAADILDRHARSGHRARAGDAGVRAALVVQDADLHGLGLRQGKWRLREHQQGGAGQEDSQLHDVVSDVIG